MNTRLAWVLLTVLAGNVSAADKKIVFIATEVHNNNWPTDAQDAAAIILYCNGGDGHPLLVGERSEIIPELAPRPDELVVSSHGYDKFLDTPLDLALRSRNITHVIITGVATDVCVNCTVLSAANRNYYVTVATDGVGFEASDQAARLRGEVSNLLESGIAPDGKRHWWKVFKFPMPGRGGETWIGGLAIDVSDLVLAKTRLRDFEQDLADHRLVPEAPRGNLEQLGRLPPRLRQMLELLAAGWNIKETAQRLGISHKTAEAHRTKLLQRLGVRSVVEATRFYLEHTAVAFRS